MIGGAEKQFGGLASPRGGLLLGLMIVAIPVAVGFAVTSAADEVLDRAPGVGMAVMTLSIVTIVAIPRLLSGDWAHPTAFPTLYVGVASLMPALYILLTGWPLATLEVGEITRPVVAVFALATLSIMVGSLVGSRGRRVTPASYPVDYKRTRSIGRATVALALVVRLWDASQAVSVPYGTNSVAFGFEGFVETFASLLLLGGTLLIVVSNIRLAHRTLQFKDGLLLVAFALATLSVGSRGELIAPALLILLMHHQYVSRLSPLRVGALALVIIVLFQGVVGLRAGEQFAGSSQSLIERTLLSLSSPLEVQSRVSQLIPSNSEFRLGSTYVAAAKRQLPSPVSQEFFGEPNDTGAFEYRALVGLRDRNFGLGFSLPSEGYMNFGWTGVAIAGLTLGLLLGWSYRRWACDLGRPLAVAYPLLVASLPHAFRADSVEQVKVVIYPLLLVVLVRYLAPGTERHMAENR